MKNSKIFASGVILLLFLSVGAASWFFFFKGNSYDPYVREISLKLDSLAQEELGDGATISSLQTKISLFKTELDSSSTKIPPGGNEQEATVRLYFSTSSDYLKAKSRWLDAMAKRSVLTDKASDPSSFTGHCSSYSDAMSAGRCMIDAMGDMRQVASSLEESDRVFKKAVGTERTALLAVVESKKKADALVSKNAVVATPSFDKLISVKIK